MLPSPRAADGIKINSNGSLRMKGKREIGRDGGGCEIRRPRLARVVILNLQRRQSGARAGVGNHVSLGEHVCGGMISIYP